MYCSVVAVKVTFLTEASPTQQALKRLLACVRARVPLEVCRPQEALGAQRTRVRCFVRVRSGSHC